MHRRSLVALVVAALATPCLVSSAARAAEVAAAKAAPPDAPPTWGLMLDAGAPDGFNASIVARPFSFLRMQLGGGSNLVSKGVRAGLALVPFGAGPSLTIEGGHYFDGDANDLGAEARGQRLGGQGHLQADWLLVRERAPRPGFRPPLGDVLPARRAQLHPHGPARCRQPARQQRSERGMTHVVAFKQDIILRAVTPSAKVGLVVYFW